MQVITGIHNTLKLLLTFECILSRHLEEQPKQKWRKAQMKEWLDSKGTIFYSFEYSLVMHVF